MKMFYCIFAILMAFMCGFYISRENWFCATVYLLCAFSDATLFVRECNRYETDGD